MAITGGDVMPQYRYPATKQLAQPINYGEKCGLSGTVGADDANELLRPYLKGYPPQSDIFSIGNDDILNIYNGRTHFSPPISYFGLRLLSYYLQ
jgi:hypothetical protein